MGCLVLEMWVAFRHQRGSRAPAPLAGDRKMRVLAVGEAVIGAAFERDRGVLGARAGRIGAVVIGGEVVDDCCEKVVILAAAVVVGMVVGVVAVAVAAEIGGGNWTFERRLEVQPRVW
jgi:hypothetical protein